jgi:hypothetical protein
MKEDIVYVFEDDRSINGHKDQFITKDEFENLILSGDFGLLHAQEPGSTVVRKVWVNKAVPRDTVPYTQA